MIIFLYERYINETILILICFFYYFSTNYLLTIKTKKMKKIILFAVVCTAVSISSCKKNYACECVKSGAVTFNTTVSAKSSSDAKSTCSVYDNSSNGTCTIK